MEHIKFEEMNISNEILRAVLDMGFEEATPIQSQAIPAVLEGKDIIGQSQTGTGKTAAFGIPCLERIDPDDRRLQAMILCPTRELAIQVSEEFRKLLQCLYQTIWGFVEDHRTLFLRKLHQPCLTSFLLW